MAINSQELQGRWNELRGKIREKWGQLTDDDLRVEGGNLDQFIGRIQKRTGEGREAIEAFLTDLTSQGSSAVARAAESARDYAAHAGERLSEGYDQVAERSREGYRRAEGMVRHHPGSSVATAFGLGFIIGVLFGMTLRSR
jgi:uncharacterized protein YjbJ (UPF0337 family)